MPAEGAEAAEARVVERAGRAEVVDERGSPPRRSSLPTYPGPTTRSPSALQASSFQTSQSPTPFESTTRSSSSVTVTGATEEGGAVTALGTVDENLRPNRADPGSKATPPDTNASLRKVRRSIGSNSATPRRCLGDDPNYGMLMGEGTTHPEAAQKVPGRGESSRG